MVLLYYKLWNHYTSYFGKAVQKIFYSSRNYKISREKLEPEPGFPKAQTMGLVSINNLIWIAVITRKSVVSEH